MNLNTDTFYNAVAVFVPFEGKMPDHLGSVLTTEAINDPSEEVIESYNLGVAAVLTESLGLPKEAVTHVYYILMIMKEQEE